MIISTIRHFLFRIALFSCVFALPIFTFIFGIIGTLVWQEFISPPNVSLCQLAQNPYFYMGRTVQVEADAFSSFGTVFIVDKSCSQGQTAASGVWKAEGYEPSSDIQKLYSESDFEKHQARILVTGRFDPHATKGCYVPKFAIRATKIELKSEIKTQLIEKREE